MADAVKVPVRESVGAALRFVRANAGFVAIVAAGGAAISAALAAIQANPLISILVSIALMFLAAALYAALTRAVLSGPASVTQSLPGDAPRMFGAMAVISFFMLIVFFVLLIPGVIVFAIAVLSPYATEMESMGEDSAAMMALMTRAIGEHPVPVLILCLVYGAIWIYLTSRLYLAAPATLAAGRVLTFETWGWTKGAGLGISWARIMLLFPAYVLVYTLTLLAGRLFNIDVLSPAAMQAAAADNTSGFAAYTFLSQFVSLMIYTSLEAGLSTALYRGLRPHGSS